MEAIFTRSSVRKFEERPVEPEKIEKILRAAMAAPSAKNQQPWEFFVVTAKNTLLALSQATPYAMCVKNAPAAFVLPPAGRASSPRNFGISTWPSPRET